MENDKIIQEEKLDEVSGGLADLRKLKEELLAELPAEVKEKLEFAKTDVQVCQLLADHGVDLYEMEKKIKNAGFDLNKIYLQLSDNEMAGVSGGGIPIIDDFKMVCAYCGNNDRDEISKQFIISLLISKVQAAFRCKKCGKYTIVYKGGGVEYLDESAYNEKFF